MVLPRFIRNLVLARQRADLMLSYRFLQSEKLGDFTVRGELRNLFDEDYAYVKG